MKAPLWTFLFLSLCVPGRADCQADCLACSLLLPQPQAFTTLVCLLECEAQVSPALTWDLCYQAVGLKPARDVTPSKRSESESEPVAVVSVEDDGGVEYAEALERFRHAAQALGGHQPSDQPQGSDQLRPIYQARTEEEEEEEETQEQEDEEQDAGAELNPDPALDLSKRFGGFLKGRQGFRKLVSSGRPLQKRYGGFIGIRKSARKWNNQKRVSQLLRQYLSLTSRSGRSGRPKNKI